MINGFAYAYEDLQVMLQGQSSPLDGLLDIKYMTKKDHFNIHGRGNEPVEMGRGQKDYEGEMTVLQSTVEALQRTLPKGRDLTDLAPFGVTVAFAPAGGVLTTDQLTFVRIKEVPKGMGTDDPTMRITIPIAIGKINYNV